MSESSKQALWLSRIGSWRRSGLSRRVWCDRQGVNVHTFDYWRRRLREVSVPSKRKARASLVPIAVVPAAPLVALELVLPSGLRIRVPEGADAGRVAAWVRALGAC